MLQNGYIGTYTSGRSQGIYRFTFDTEKGMLSAPELFAAARNPKCIARRGSVLASAIQIDGQAGVALWDTRHLGQAPISMCAAYTDWPASIG